MASLLALLALSTLSHLTTATVGVLDIDDLLNPDLTAALHAPIEQNPNAPWSHPPHCTTSTALATLGQKYCVYTSNATGPHGLSLIAKPEHAARATQYLNDIPLASFLTQKQAEALYLGGGQPWKVVPIPGKDRGVVATRRIKKYETFMLDQAAVVVDMELEKAVSGRENNRLLKIAVDRLLVPGMIRDMSGAHNDRKDQGGDHEEEEEEGRLEEDIMKTNAFGSTVADISTRALFPLISRINHACNPNSFVLFSRAGISMAIKAYRDIEEGEEISISYLLLGMPSQTRTHLLTRWGFTCTCALCSLPTPEKRASDTRRVLLARAEDKILALAQSYRLADAIALTHESIDMIVDEDIYPMLTDEYAMLAMLYLEAGERENAERYGRLAWQLLADLGFLGVGEERPVFSLEKLLGNMGRLGGEGKAGLWKRKA